MDTSLKPTRTVFVHLAIVLLAMLAGAARAQDDAPPLVAGWVEMPPYFLQGPTGNEPTGYAADLAKALAERAGVGIAFRRYATPEGLIEAQASGASHLLAAVTADPRLEPGNLFTDPVATSDLRLFVRIEDADRIDVDAMRRVRIGEVRGPAHDRASGLLRRNEAVDFDDRTAMYFALLTGNLQGFLGDEDETLNALKRARLDHRIVPLEPVLGSEPRVVALHEDRADLFEALNGAVAEMQADGSLDALRRSWAVGRRGALAQPDVLSVGVTHYPPYTIVNDDGSFSGLSVEALSDLAARAGLRLNFQAVSLEEWIAGPGPDSYDMLPQAGINNARRRIMDFTLPVERAEFSIFVPRGDGDDVASLDDLADRVVGVQAHHFTEQVAIDHGGLALQTLPDAQSLFQALAAGEIDAALYARSVGASLVEEIGAGNEIEAVDPPFTVSERAPALRFGLGAVRERLNAVIPGYLVSSEYQALREAYFGPSDAWSTEQIRRAVALVAPGLALLLVVLGAGYVALSHRARVQAERLIAQTQTVSSRLGAVLDAAQSGIIGLDRHGLVAFANPRARHMLGGLDAQVPFAWPKDISFVDSDDMKPLDSSEHPINRALSGHSLKGENTVMTRRNGTDPRYVRVSSARVDSSGDTDVGTVVILDDVSEQEKNRQQVERSGRLDALGQLTGGIAHDFNNLLATIEYSVQLAMNEKIADKRASYLSTALASVRRGADLTQRLLAFAKRQPGLAKSRLVEDILMEFARLAKPTIEETIDLEFTTEDSDLFVFCDVPQLENALLNLVLNSRDAILRQGRGNRIVVRARGVAEIEADSVLRREDPHSYIAKGLHMDHASARAREDGFAYRYVEFAVTDNGPGMTDEVKRRAIDPFFTTKDTNSGTGLGLSMVYGFIQQSNGEMRIYSELGYGTTVRMLLPRGTPTGEREQPVERLPAPTGIGQRILIVEDEDSLLTMMIDIIKSLGYTVVSARSGKQALGMVQKGERFDLLLTDVVMPGGIGGFELAREVRKLHPDTPVIYMSGYTGFSADEMGAVVAPLVQKPSSPTELARVIERALGTTVHAGHGKQV